MNTGAKFSIMTILISWFYACAEEPLRKKDRRLGRFENADSKAEKNGAGPNNSQSPNSPGNSDQDTLNDAGDKDTISGPTNDNGETTFINVVQPAFKTANCSTCHADPRESPPIQAPLTIYSYESMKLLLGQNALFDKVLNIIPHGGGDQCRSELTNSPCKELLSWWDAEYLNDPSKANDRPVAIVGELRLISATGTISGWASEPDNDQINIKVNFYIDGPSGTGTLVGETIADLEGFDNETPGPHAFQVALPADLIDNKEHTLYAYAIIAGNEVALASSPKTYTAFGKKPGGADFYNANVANTLGRCQACHTFNYDSHWASLATPTPAGGGTATNNTLYNKVSGGVDHAGGTFCNEGGSPCSQFINWWNFEFGQ